MNKQQINQTQIFENYYKSKIGTSRRLLDRNHDENLMYG